MAQEVGQTSSMFLVHPTISNEQMAWVCTELDTVLQSVSQQ